MDPDPNPRSDEDVDPDSDVEPVQHPDVPATGPETPPPPE
jgi:hypothetical protein